MGHLWVPVAEQDVGGEVLAGRPAAEGDAQATREPEAERARRHVDAGGDRHVRVALHPAVDGVEGHELLGREVAPHRQHGVQGDGAVALGEHEPIARWIVGVRGVVAEHAAEVERDEDVDGAELAADVAEAGFTGYAGVGRGRAGWA